MPIDKASYQKSLIDAFKAARDITDHEQQDKAIEDLCKKLAEAAVTLLQSQTIIVNGVTTTGSPSAQAQTVPVEATIS